ncbi:MAG: hypothetical protein KGO23_05835 [Nitrospirota bacterium]|nr:hypothetical protein [Nitrospirota bacterium]
MLRQREDELIVLFILEVFAGVRNELDARSGLERYRDTGSLKTLGIIAE